MFAQSCIIFLVLALIPSEQFEWPSVKVVKIKKDELIAINGALTMDGVAYTRNHAEIGTDAYNEATSSMEDIFKGVRGFKGIDNLAFRDKDGKVEASYRLIFKKPVESPRNSLINIQNPFLKYQHAGLKHLEDTIRNAIFENAKEGGIAVKNVRTRVAPPSNQHGRRCFVYSDCTDFPGGYCSNGVCICLSANELLECGFPKTPNETPEV